MRDHVACDDCGEVVAREMICGQCLDDYGERLCADCCECGQDQEELFDADELGLDPELDDERRYKPI